MPNFIKKTFLSVIFPTILFTAAIFPFSCNFSRDLGVYKSEDNGQSWQQKVKIDNSKTIDTKSVLSMTVDKINSSVIYLGTVGSGLWKSSDAANSWQPMIDQAGALKNNADIYDIKIDGQNQAVIYLAINQDEFGRVFKTEDGGAHWREIFIVSKSGLLVYSVFIDNLNNGNIYIGTSDGALLRSSDFGASWRKINSFSGGVTDIKIDPSANNTLYIIAASRGLYKSQDNGQTWIFLNDKMVGLADTQSAGEILINPRDSKILYVRLKDSLITSSDGGETWRAVTILMPANSVAITAFAQDQQNPENFYYAAGSVFYKSSNSGQTWTTIQMPGSRLVSAIKIDSLSSNVIYAGRY